MPAFWKQLISNIRKFKAEGMLPVQHPISRQPITPGLEPLTRVLEMYLIFQRKLQYRLFGQVAIDRLTITDILVLVTAKTMQLLLVSTWDLLIIDTLQF